MEPQSNIRCMAEIVAQHPRKKTGIWYYRFENGDVLRQTRPGERSNNPYTRCIIPKDVYVPENEIAMLLKCKYNISVHRVENGDKWKYIIGDGYDGKLEYNPYTPSDFFENVDYDTPIP